MKRLVSASVAAVAISFLLASGSFTAAAPLPSSAAYAPGKIVFGTSLHSGLKLSGQRTTFHRGNPFAWVATFGQGAGATKLQLVIARVGAGGSETSVVQLPVSVTNPSFNVIGNKVSWSVITGIGAKPSHWYVMRYIRGGTVLAAGRFQITW